MRVKVLIQKQLGRILTIQDGEFYHLPGGDVLPGEDPTEAAARLLKEQTGMVAGNMVWVYEDMEDGVLTTTFDVELKTNPKRGSAKNCKWVGPTHLSSNPYDFGLLSATGTDFVNAINDVVDV
jgi:8-oxo-dGTP pyrophosphatase MutT (NUDIX family)